MNWYWYQGKWTVSIEVKKANRRWSFDVINKEQVDEQWKAARKRNGKSQENKRKGTTRGIWYSNCLVLTSMFVGFMTDAASLFRFQHIMQRLWLSFPVLFFSSSCIFFLYPPSFHCLCVCVFFFIKAWLSIWISDAPISLLVSGMSSGL